MADSQSITPQETFHPQDSAHCSERGCPFPPAPGETLCRQHVEMFASEESLYSLAIDATEDDVSSAIFYDKSISVKTHGQVPLDEWLENKTHEQHDKALFASLKKRLLFQNRIQSGMCGHCGVPRGRDRQNLQSCTACGKMRVKIAARVYAERRADGLCVECGRVPAAKPGLRCPKCIEKGKSKHARKVNASLKLPASLRLYSTPQVAEFVGVHHLTLLSWIRAGNVGVRAGRERFWKSGKSLVWTDSDVKKLLRYKQQHYKKWGKVSGLKRMSMRARKLSARRTYKSCVDRWRREGRCVKCGSHNPDPAYLTCPTCRERNRERNRESVRALYHRRRSQGCCGFCGVSMSGQAGCRCARCKKKNSLYYRKNVLQRTKQVPAA